VNPHKAGYCRMSRCSYRLHSSTRRKEATGTKPRGMRFKPFTLSGLQSREGNSTLVLSRAKHFCLAGGRYRERQRTHRVRKKS